jgi:hypothetical protein
MSTHQLDAEIAILQLDGKEVFLDPGSKFCPFGLLAWKYSNTQGLRQRFDKGTELGTSPLPGYNQAIVQRTAHLKLLDDGSVEGTVVVAYLGLEAMDRRQEGGKTDAEGQKKQLVDELKGWLPGGTEVTLTKAPDWNSVGTPMVAEFAVKGPLASGTGKRWLLPTYVFQINEKPLFAAAERAQSIAFDHPYREIDQEQFSIPAGTEVESLPSPASLQIEGAALYQASCKKDASGMLVASRDLALASTPFPPDMYKQIKGFFDQVKAADDAEVILKKAGTASGN